MSVGMPIISVNVGGVIEQIINEYNGFIVNKYDLDDFVKKVIYFLDNKEKIEEMGNNGYLHFNSSFSIEKMINNYHKELEIKI